MFLQLFIIAVIGTSVLADPLVRDAVINRLNTYDILNIPFFKGIIEGDLSPYCYTRLLIQDSYYLDSNTLLWDVTRKMVQNDPQFMEFCNQKYQQRLAYSKQSRSKITINEFGGMANAATISYTQDQKETVTNNNGYYALLANYGCSSSWPLLAQKLKPLARRDNNPYYFWIDENQSFAHALQYEELISKYVGKFNSDWVGIVERMVDHEIAFFRAVCPEEIS